MLIWVLGLCCLAATLKSQNIAVASFMLVFFNIASLALVEWYVFHNILTPQQIVGLVLGLGAVLMLQTAAP
jgi:multidrug transporter EmrE-like cation transporter